MTSGFGFAFWIFVTCEPKSVEPILYVSLLVTLPLQACANASS